MRLQTAFFVEEDRLSNEGGNSRPSERIDIEWIVVGKKAGLSLAEINEFRIRDLVAYVEIYTGADKDKPSIATQVDIDRFFAG